MRGTTNKTLKAWARLSGNTSPSQRKAIRRVWDGMTSKERGDHRKAVERAVEQEQADE